MGQYLQRLTLRLAAGALRLPEAVRRLHTNFIRSRQADDGGFLGRDGDSDLYYTGFALRSLFLLGELSGPVADRAARFLQRSFATEHNVLDLLSLTYGVTLLDWSAGSQVLTAETTAWQDVVADQLERLRRHDGGYAKTRQSDTSSTYASFLVALCLQLIDRPLPQPDRLLAFILSQRCEDGGFRDVRTVKRAGVNPTAAAIGVLRLIEALESRVADEAISFLSRMQTAEGGLRANTRIPVADLLSTFTGIHTLVDLSALDAINRSAALRFARGLQDPGGGFRGAAWDTDADVEYAFYGLGCLALLEP